MNLPGALAFTGLVFIFLLALPCAIASDSATWRTREVAGRLGWFALIAGAFCLAGAGWWEALS